MPLGLLSPVLVIQIRRYWGKSALSGEKLVPKIMAEHRDLQPQEISDL